MDDREKTKEELIAELVRLQQKVAEAEARHSLSSPAEEALRMALLSAKEEKTRAEAIINAMGDAVSIQDSQFRVLYQNDAHRSFVGSHSGEYCYKAYNRRTSVCEDCPVALCFRDGEVHTVEKDGNPQRGPLRVEITASPLKDDTGRILAGIEVVRDITGRRRAEEGLREAEAKFRTLVEQSITGIYIIQGGRLVYANPRLAEIFGRTVEELLAHPSVMDFIVEADRARVEENIRRRIAGDIKDLHYTFRGLRGDGAIIDIEAHGSVTLYNGRPAVMGTLIDITARKQTERDSARTQKLESLGLLAGYMANQFNNILTALSGNIVLAKMYAKPESEVFEILSDAEKAARRAEGLTRRLLTFARERIINKAAISVRDLLEDFLGSHPRYQQEHVVLALDDSLWLMEVDEVLISDVLDNIVENAALAMPSGGTITVSAKNVTVDADSPVPAQPGRYVRLTVSDEGPGIDTADIERIFEPFFTTRSDGVGLGLTSAATIIRDHGGHITVDSTPGRGSSFHMFLPAAAGEEKKTGTSRCMAFTSKRRVLVMDDEEMIRTVIDRMLTQCGCSADFAKNGEEMLQLYKRSMEAGSAYDAVILDLIITEGMGGEEAIRRLLKLDSSARAIVTSGQSDCAVMTFFAEAGFRASLAKPYTISELCTALHAVIEPGP